jgi:uncharacterized phage protein gp47/JayE
MTTYPLATLSAQVTETGIAAPAYIDILLSLKASYQAIYGSDVYLEADSQDGQLLAIFAQAISDANSTAIAVYNAFSPQTAKGVGLSRVVKINGIERQNGSNSTADVTLIGQVGALIVDGAVGDAANNRWTLPSPITIPDAGEIVVTATCAVAGAVSAAAGSIRKILTPTLGWQSVTNAADATLGSAVEDDVALRQRQGKSVARPSITALEGLIGEVADVSGVTRLRAYENDTAATDDNGLPPHSVALVVDGGDALDVAKAIASKKTPGAYTYGATSESVPDIFNVPHTIRFFRPTEKRVDVTVTIHALTGYTSAIGVEIQNAVSTFISKLDIGDDVLLTRLYVPAQLSGAGDSSTYEVTNLQICFDGGSLGTADLVVAFNEAAFCDPADVTIVVI